MRQEIPNSSSCGYRIDGSCMDTCRAHRCVKKAHASFFPSLLDEIYTAQTDCCADDYVRNFNIVHMYSPFLFHIREYSSIELLGHICNAL